MAQNNSGGCGCLILIVIAVIAGISNSNKSSSTPSPRPTPRPPAPVTKAATPAPPAQPKPGPRLPDPVGDKDVADWLDHICWERISLERQEDILRAKEFFEKTKAAPDSIEHRNNKAVALWLIGAETEAKGVLENLLTQRPELRDNPGILMNANLISGTPLNRMGDTGKIVKAQMSFNAAETNESTFTSMAMDPDLPRRLKAKTYCRVALNDAKKATARAASTSSAGVLFPASGIRRLDPEVERAYAAAVASFKRAADADPQAAIGKLALENVARLEAWHGVLQDQQRKGRVSSLLSEGKLMLTLRRWADAEKKFTEALRESPGNKEAEAGLRDAQAGGAGDRVETSLRQAKAYLDKERWDDAVTAFTDVLKTSPDNAEARTGLERAKAQAEVAEGRRFLRNGRIAEAEAAFKQILASKPNSAAAKEGLDDVRKARKARYDAAMTEGWNHLTAKRVSSAETAFRQALIWMPDDPEALKGIEAAKKGQAAPKAPDKDKEKQNAAAERLLQTACNFILNSRNDDAAEILSQIITEYPDTSAAAKADRLLKRIKASSGK